MHAVVADRYVRSRREWRVCVVAPSGGRVALAGEACALPRATTPKAASGRQHVAGAQTPSHDATVRTSLGLTRPEEWR